MESATTDNEYETARAEALSWCNDAAGHSEQEVLEALGDGDYRITQRDGKPRIVTRDFNPFRVNLHIDNGVVTKAYLG